MARDHPDTVAGTSNTYQNWEVVDPEKWVPDGYACVRVDSRGTGRSPGRVDPFSPRETRDFHDWVEWAGTRDWSQGAFDPHTPVAQGWPRASRRRPDPELSTAHRPYHLHDRAEPLEPGEVYVLDIEILPTCLVVPAGYRIALQVRGKDYVQPGARRPAVQPEERPHRLRAVPAQRRPGPRRGDVRRAGAPPSTRAGGHASNLPLPVIPGAERARQDRRGNPPTA
ncbi:hypothetical protein EW053_03150 [Streptomyces sp. IB2014 016-6]|nr:hypothetical protein EW053_03150 [Streptomyces sp. IB2014 016-6]